MISPVIVDVYPRDKPVDWTAYIAAGHPFVGAVFKLSQGLHYEYAGWAYQQRQPFVRSPRYGVDLLDGFYHYLDFGSDGTRQADWFWGLMERIGGEQIGTLWAMVDAERGGQTVALTKSRVEGCIGAFAQRYQQLSGRTATLYGGELLRAIGAHGRYGCGRSSVALYASELHGLRETTAQFLARTGTDLAHLLSWQYQGTEAPSGPAGYPRLIPGGGAVTYDISALTLPGGLEALRSQLWAERP